MQSLAHTSSTRLASRRPLACRSTRPVLRRVSVHPTPTRFVITRAAEETTTSTEEPTSSQQSSDEQPVHQSPIERARAALASEVVDNVALESALSELNDEMARLQDTAAAAESRASVLESTVASAKDQLLRLNADFDNFRRRSKEEKDAVAESVRGDVITQLLPLVDNFELARTQIKTETEAEAKINNSYQALYKQMVDIMRGLGIHAVPTVGTPFDPSIHDAIMREPNAEHPDNTVLMEFRKGFKIGDKLLRAAMVKVSMEEGDAPPSDQ